jgi:hypothetical protein
VFYFGGFLAAELGLRALNNIRFGNVETLDVQVSELKEKQPSNETVQAVKKPRKGFYITKETGLRLPYANQNLGFVKINNHGFRGPDIQKEKPSGLMRFAFLGSSTTYDAEIKDGKTWPEQVISNLSSAISGCEIDFINAGLPGFSTDKMELYWHTVVREFDPDIVIVLPGDMTNDIQRAASAKGYDRQQYMKKSWLSEYSIMWETIEKNMHVLEVQRKAFSEQEKFKPNYTELASEFSHRLDNLIKAVLKQDVFLVVPTIASHIRRDMPPEKQLVAADSALFYMPYVSIPTLIDLQEIYNQAIRDTVSRYKAPLLVTGDETILPDNRHFTDSRHFTAQGSAVMGKRIANALLASSQFHTYLKASSRCSITANNLEDKL